MSWEIAIMAVSSAVQAAQAKAAADESAYQSDVQAMVARENAEAAKIEAKEQELRRRRSREEEKATNNNMAAYDPLGSRHHLALEGYNKDLMERDVDAFGYRGFRVGQNLELERESHERAARAANTEGKLAIASSALNFAGKAYKLKGPASTGLEDTGTGLQDTGNREPIYNFR